jgi:hypothetical protein
LFNFIDKLDLPSPFLWKRSDNNCMKTGIHFGFSVALIASCLAVRAYDTPAQAIARAALEQKLKELDGVQSQPAPPLSSVVIAPDQTATNVIPAVPAATIPAPVAPAAPPPVAVVVASAPLPTPSPRAVPVPPARAKPASKIAVPKPARAMAKVETTNSIVTIYGTVYKNATVEKVDTNGIIISYQPSGGGVAMSKVYFEDLPYELRRQFQSK